MGTANGGFRERVEVPTGGLVLPGLPMGQGGGLVLDTSFDPSTLGDFSAPQIKVEGVSEQIQAAGAEGIVTSDELNRLDEGLKRIQAAQQDRKLAELMAKVQDLINSERFKEAIRLLDKALEDEPGVAALYMMKAHCLMQIDDYDQALDVLNLAEGVGHDLETILFVVILKRACTHHLAQEAEREIVALVQAEKVEEALSFVARKLRRMPDSSVLIFHRSTLLLLLGRIDEAKRSALEGLERAAGGEKALFAQFLKQILLLESMPFLEMARQAFRRGDRGEAFRILESRRQTLEGNERFEIFHAYLLEKAMGAVGRMFHPGAKKLLSGETMETFLLWMMSEEISSGVELMGKEKFDEAIVLFKQAAKFESRCRLIRFLHAVAIVKGFQASMTSKRPPDLDKAAGELKVAAELCEGLGEDQRIGDQSKNLKDAANGYVKQIAEAKVQIKEKKQAAKPVQSLIKEFNSFMDGLNKSPISSIGQLNRAESRLKEMREKVRTKRKEIKDSDARSGMDQLESAISKVLSQLDDARYGRTPNRPASSSSWGSSSSSSSTDDLLNPWCPTTKAATDHMMKMVTFINDHPALHHWERKELDEMVREMRSLVQQAARHASSQTEKDMLAAMVEWAEKL